MITRLCSVPSLAIGGGGKERGGGEGNEGGSNIKPASRQRRYRWTHATLVIRYITQVQIVAQVFLISLTQ